MPAKPTPAQLDVLRRMAEGEVIWLLGVSPNTVRLGWWDVLPVDVFWDLMRSGLVDLWVETRVVDVWTLTDAGRKAVAQAKEQSDA